MIKGKNPNRLQKSLLMNNGYEWSEWLVIKVYSDSVLFRHKTTEESITLYFSGDEKRF